MTWVNYKDLKEVYHTDSVESTSKLQQCTYTVINRYTILTLWSQLQNGLPRLKPYVASIPYWLCGVNFKMTLHGTTGSGKIYHTDSVESTSKYWSVFMTEVSSIPYWLCGVNFKMISRRLNRRCWIYHTDSVESTSKWSWCIGRRCAAYTILTLWSQLQNAERIGDKVDRNIPYWLCGVNFKICLALHISHHELYHTDSVESTSKYGETRCATVTHYTILTLWSQLQNKTSLYSGTRLLYTILTLWSQLQNSDEKGGPMKVDIPYWLCGVNFKIILRETVMW